MQTSPAVIDTNVVVAGLLTSTPGSAAARILDGMLAGRFPFLVSPDLMAEYREVLLRPRIQRRHGLSDLELDAILKRIAEHGSAKAPAPIAQRAPDPKDNHLWELLATEPGSHLVTSDVALLENPPSFGRVVSPQAFAGSF